MSKKNAGFTLSEILITLLILGFIGALGVPMLGQQKIKKPVEAKYKHGTMECFWQNGRLMQYLVDNEDTAGSYELKDVTQQGYCLFTAPSANLFQLQAVGAGGIGAYQLSSIPGAKSATEDVSGTIPTGANFSAAINKTEVPDWVRNYWDKQWKSDKSNWVQYELSSPVGASGDAACEHRVKVHNAPEYCTSLCEVGDNCPSECRDDIEAKGGDSGAGAKFLVKTIIRASDTVDYGTKDQTVYLSIGGNSAMLKQSGSGSNATIDALGNLKNGTEGESIKTSDKGAGFLSYGGSEMEYVKSSGTIQAQAGGTGCSNPRGKSATLGSVEVSSPKEIKYESKVLAIQATFGIAGNSGSVERKFFEKLPSSTQIMMVPASSSLNGISCTGGESGVCSMVYLKKNGSSDWLQLMQASSGANGSSYKDLLIPIAGAEDLPFPSAYYPSSFTPSNPDLSIASGKGYRSYIATNLQYLPGASGAGAYPLVRNVSGHTTYKIQNVEVGGAELTPIQGNQNYSCDENITPGNTGSGSYCGSGNTYGEPGAVVISW